MYAALAKATSHPRVNIRRKIHLNHKNKIADQFYFFCALLSFLTSGRYTAQRNAECQYEIILKFKYLTAASIGIKFFLRFPLLWASFQALTTVFSAVKWYIIF